MQTPTELTCVQESLLALEINRLYDVFQSNESGDAQRREAVDQATTWFARLWHEDRGFLHKTVLPLVVFYMFEEDIRTEDEREGPLMSVLRRLTESDSTEEHTEAVVRHVIGEYTAFATILGQDEASKDALVRVTRCFLAVVSRHALCVETLNDAFVQCVMNAPGKKSLLQAFENSERLTPNQKIAIFLHICNMEPAASIREHAARSLQPFATHISSASSVIPLLADKSRKVRQIAASCIMTVGMECLREESDDRTTAEIIVKIADQVSGATREKRFTSFVRRYFADAKTLDEMCDRSIYLDEAGASSNTMMLKILPCLMGTLLSPSFFQGDAFSQRSDSSSL